MFWADGDVCCLSLSLHLEPSENQREGVGSFSSHPSKIKKCWIPNTQPCSPGRNPSGRSSFPRVAEWREPRPLISYHQLSLLSISTYPHCCLTPALLILCLSDGRQHQYSFHHTLLWEKARSEIDWEFFMNWKLKPWTVQIWKRPQSFYSLWKSFCP